MTQSNEFRAIDDEKEEQQMGRTSKSDIDGKYGHDRLDDR